MNGKIALVTGGSRGICTALSIRATACCWHGKTCL